MDETDANQGGNGGEGDTSGGPGASRTGPMPSAIGQIAVPVVDVDRARDFYGRILGLDHLFDAPGLAFFDCGGVRLMLAKPEGEGTPDKASIIYYRVDDVEAAHAALVDQGVEFVHEPGVVHSTDDYELWMAFFHDSEGNMLGLMCEVPT